MGWVNGTRASCQVAPGTARRAVVLRVAYLGSSSTTEISRKGWHSALRYRRCSLQPWSCRTLAPGNVYADPEQRCTSTRSRSCQASPLAHRNSRGWRAVSSSQGPFCRMAASHCEGPPSHAGAGHLTSAAGHSAVLQTS